MVPLAKPTAETSQTMMDYPPPTWLKHTPIFMVPYAPFDGPYSADTDAKYLSIGQAQWRYPNDPDALSAKVWRNPDNKWSRMSEELPLHRLVDLCTLLVKTFYQTHATNALKPTAIIAADTFENQKEQIELRRMADVPLGFGQESERVKSRLRKLRDELQAADLE
ncbi:DUF6530 family protein [Methylobacterium sp. 88A]|uniref:DUF6530 family protein n=1 Tax=Methylobacterium sp. 88A TaxID=1131813 RepID=UPI0012F6620A|nr:DUF6530 family protein [Methylobacterium sp. 88A]